MCTLAMYGCLKGCVLVMAQTATLSCPLRPRTDRLQFPQYPFHLGPFHPSCPYPLSFHLWIKPDSIQSSGAV